MILKIKKIAMFGGFDYAQPPGVVRSLSVVEMPERAPLPRASAPTQERRSEKNQPRKQIDGLHLRRTALFAS
jgi:hypothetical protein